MEKFIQLLQVLNGLMTQAEQVISKLGKNHPVAVGLQNELAAIANDIAAWKPEVENHIGVINDLFAEAEGDAGKRKDAPVSLTNRSKDR